MRIRLMQSTYVGTFLAAVGLIYVIFLYYTTSSNLRLAETKLEKLTEINERLAAQQQVVVGHKQRLERSLDEAKERLIAAKEDAEKRYQSVKTAEQTRYEVLQKACVSEKALKEELQQKLEQETAARVRVEEDSKRLADQNNVEYQSLKQEKDADIAKLTNDFNSQKAEAQRQKNEVDRLQTDAARLRKDLEAALADAEKAKELQKTIATLEAEIMHLRQSAASSTTAAAAAPAAPVATAAAAAHLVAVPDGSSTTAPEPRENSQAALASVVAAAGPAQLSAGANKQPQHDDGVGQYVAPSTTAGTVTAGRAAAAGGGAAPGAAAAAAAAAGGDGAFGMDIANRGADPINEQRRQLAVPLGLGDIKEHDEKVADHVGGGDDDDGGAGNGDEDDAEDRDHDLAHARPDMQVPLPQGLLMKHLRKAGVADDRRTAGLLNVAAGAGPQAAVNAADSMQMGKPPGMHDDDVEDQRRSPTRAAANQLPDAL